MFDFPDPFGPTNAVNPWPKFRVILVWNDLKPRIDRDESFISLDYTIGLTLICSETTGESLLVAMNTR